MIEKKLLQIFLKPKNKKQLQYEIVRAFVVEGMSAKEISKKFKTTDQAVFSIIREAKKNIDYLSFDHQDKKTGRKKKIDSDLEATILSMRQKNLSILDIQEALKNLNHRVSVSQLQRFFDEANVARIKQRTPRERNLTKNKMFIADRAATLNVLDLQPFKTDCPIAGIFFFIPYIIESKILDVIKKCNLPRSSEISGINACLSMLLLKLVGQERLTQIQAYDHENTFGIFAGLNKLPKSTYMNTYSCLTSEKMLLEFQEKLLKILTTQYPDLYSQGQINLDFHSIPHYGDSDVAVESLEKVWCGARGKTLRGVNTLIAQNGLTDLILYTKADILRKNEAEEILKFVEYWKKIKGSVGETLVFDCKLTKYTVLEKLDRDGIKFITLRKRNATLVKEAYAIDKSLWKKIALKIGKRKHPKFFVYESRVKIKGIDNELRQIIITGHGRENPTFIITNDHKLPLVKLIEAYAKRWHIENKLSELVSFFNLNALSSPFMIRIHFDIMWTAIADTLYNIFKRDLRRFESCRAGTIFKKFINMPGTLEYDGESFTVKIRKRAGTPVLMGVNKLSEPIQVPWLGNKNLKIEWKF